MSDVADALAGLSPERRRLLELRLAARQAQAAGPALVPRQRPDGTAPLSASQARLWVMERLEPGRSLYTVPLAFRIRGALDGEALRRALETVVHRHEALRTTFAERADGPVQVVHPPSPLPLPLLDLSTLSPEEREIEVRRRVDDDANTGFDLEAGPVFRASLLRLAKDDHALLVSMHHVASDGWSAGIFCGEASQAYAALAAGREPTLPPVPLQYADFAAWQHEHLRGETLARLVDFWRRALDGAPPALELPADRARPEGASHAGRTRVWRLEAALADRLRAFARDEDATFFHVLAAGFRAALARHSGQDDVVIGTPTAGRGSRAVEGVIGFFIDTVPLRGRVEPGTSFRALVRAEKEASLAAFGHAELPFDRLVDELRVPRDPARNPVFQAMLALQTARMDTLRLAGAEVEPLLGDVRTARFDLTLDGYEQPDGSVRLLVDYPTAVYDPGSIDRILAHWTRLLADGAAAPDLPLRALPGAAADEVELVVHALNRTAAPYERDASVHGLFQGWAKRTPDALALEYGPVRLTYAELDARADALAARLRVAGASAESRVGVAMRGRAELPLSLLAVLKAGGAYVPLDPAYPPERLAFMCADAGVSALLVAGEVPAALASFAGPILSVSVHDPPGREGDDFAPAVVPAEALAYVIHTSGSTGTPKGIGLPHRGVVRLVRDCAYAPFEADERVAQLSNPSFDALTFEVWGALLNGAALVGIDRETTLSPRALAAALRETRVTTALLPTALFNLAARLAPDGFGTLRHLLFGGEAVAPEAVRAVRAAGGPGRLVNAYGPAEGTTMATWHLVGDVAENASFIPIGLPLPNTTAYVVDAEGRPCNLGEPGELWIGGDGLARGYLGRPALTAERFVPDPFSHQAGARLYRTGDRVRRLESGALEFLGRLDAQVKVRGFRVEPGEVEAALRAIPGVRDCMVAVRGRGDEARLVAWVVPAPGAAPAPGELRDALSRRLPPYLVPSSLRVVDAIPLTANGKVDRAALPEPGDTGTEHLPPREGTEAALAEVWRQLLGGGPVGARDDFFERGGHSLLATRLVAAIRGELGVELPLRDVFLATRLDRMAARIDARRESASVDGDGDATVRPRTRPNGTAPVSSAQRRLWVIDRLKPGTPAYNVPEPLRLRGPLDVAALEAALNGLRARHESLRTTFAARQGEPVQVIHPFAPVSLPVADLSALGDKEREAEASRLADVDTNTGFDLHGGPLMRATLVRLAEDDHLLLWCLHHIVTDGASLDLLRRELATLYAAARGGAPSPLPPPALQYADFAAWEREYLTGERTAAAEAFWRATLEDAPPALEIPTNHPRPPEESHRGARTPVLRLAPEAVAPLRELARREGTTLLAVLLAAARVVLERASGQDDVVIGTPATGRLRPELEGVAGFFTNLLPVRAPRAANASFRALLRAERDALLAALAHQELPFERIVEALRLPRDASRHPLFQATLSLADGGGRRWGMGGIRVEPFPAEYRQAKADVDFDVVESGEEIELAAYYAADLFAPAAAQRLVDHLVRVLRAAAEAPDQPLSRLPLADAEELARVDAWGRAEPGDAGGTLHAIFSEAVARAPDAPAVVWEGGGLTYAELDARAAVVDRRLRALGAGPETLVGMVLEPSPEAVAAVLGILRAGAAYLPIDPAVPDARVAEVLADAGAVAVVGRATDAERANGLPLLDVDAPEARGETGNGQTAVAIAPGSLAYVIYTSGSTGRPKGVAVPHGAAALHARAAARVYGLSPSDRCVLFASLAFDQSVDVLFPAFAAGASVVPRGPEVWSPAETVEKVRRLGVTVMELPTGYWTQLAREPEIVAELKTRLRCVLPGGEEMRVDAVEAWERAPGECALLNVYGPTETVVTATCFAVPAGFSGARPARVPLGAAMAGRVARVLDAALRPVGIGTPGELCLGGAALARGYLGRPALTAERFVPDPWSPEPGARMYRTGDRARWTEGGALEYLGRADAQVKVRGHRVEPGEIEAALRVHPAIADAAVDARPDASGAMRLVAYVVARDGVVANAEALRAHLAARLPAQMVPAAFVAMHALPRTAGGKLDRRALPEPELPTDRGFTAPATADEAALAALWSELLGVERVGADDDFIVLGGHSLLALRVVARAAAAFGVELPLRAVFEAPTVRSLARKIGKLRAESGAATAGPIPRADRSAPLRASFAQERMWFLQQLDPSSAAYNVPRALRLRGALDPRALRGAISALVARHEALRTVFADGAEGPAQVILPPDAFAWDEVDLAHLPDAGEEALRRARAEAATPFDLARGPVLRAVLMRIADSDWLLSLVVHHAAADAGSWEVIHRELAALFAREPLSPLPVQYADYADWQRGWLRGGALERQAAYWRGRLAGAPALLELPTDRPRPAVQDLRGALHAFRIAPEVADAARSLAASEGATPFMVLLAAFAVVLHRWSGEEDLVVGTPVAHRPRPELEEVVGFFSNTLPLRADLSGHPGFRALLRRLRETLLEAHAHQDLPFEKLVDELRVERSLSHAPLFQVMFTLRQGAGASLELPGVAVEEVTAGAGTARYDLTLILSEAADGALEGWAEYATALWDAPTVARMAGHLEAIVRAAAADPESPVATLPMLSDEEREAVVERFNRTEGEMEPVPVHALVARQAAATPDAVAMEHGGAALSYAELEARANRLAHRLIALGAGPDARVAVAMERSVEMGVAVLAVLKAGAGYVAVDPAYPAERVAFMLADSRAAVVVTTAEVAARLPSTDAPVLAVDTRAPEIAAGPSTTPSVDLHPENLLYVLYTSGSTGRPKGAALPHRALVNLLRWQLDRWGDAKAARTLQFASLSFDVSFQEIFSTWAAGGTLVLVDDDTRRDGEALLSYLREHRIERLFLPFAALQNLAEAAESADARLPRLREVITAGEALRSTPQLRAFFRANPRARLENQYGPSETHVVSAHALEMEPEGWPALPPIGEAVRNTRLYVLDAAMSPSPLGVPGELYAGGANLARGYAGRPALTAERFIPDPFGPAGARLYRTGDRARRRADGALEYVGRTDQQVKVRGFRVEPGEIEAVLSAHPLVAQAAVAVRGEGAARRLAAYLVPAAGTSPSIAELRAHAAARLPEPMVPAAWTVLPALPLTPSGKVDRRALPEPDAVAGDAARLEPRTPAERIVADAWEAVLKVRPGAHDDFFALGGHSLAATRVVARIRRAFGIDLPLRAIFEAPTVAGLAARAADARRGGRLALPPLLPSAPGEESPLSFAQQRFWFLERMGAAEAAYHVPLALTLRGELDVGALRVALNGLVARHESLRTTFHLRGTVPMQAVHPPFAVPLPAVDLSPRAENEKRGEAERIARAEWMAPFDLARGPLLRARLLRLGGEEHRLLLTFHHIVTDAWSLGIVFRELGELYAAAREARDPALPPLAVRYADYAAWQHERLGGVELEDELEFWRRRLEGAPVMELPADRPRPPVQSFRGAAVPFRLSRESAVRVGEVARSEGATPFMVLLAAFDVVLSRWSGLDDVVVGSPVAGRVPEETEPLVGVFVNTLALRAGLGGDPAFREVVAGVREATLDAYAHQEVPFERLVDALKIERSLGRHPLFQVIFSMHADGPGAPELPGLAVTVEEGGAETSKVDLVLALAEEEDGLAGAFQYASDLFDEETIRRLASHLAVLLDAALADPSLPISVLPLATSDEQALFDSFRATAEGDAARAHVLDRHRRPAPTGVPGDLYLADDGGALVPTGERARWRVDGRLERVGTRAPADGVAADEPSPGAPPRVIATPRTGLEHEIARVWEEVLGMGSVRVDDNFFEIGGHSLLLAPVQEKLRERLTRDVSIVELFQYPTVEALAAFLAPPDAGSTRDDDATADADADDSSAPSAARGRGAGRREMLRRGRR